MKIPNFAKAHENGSRLLDVAYFEWMSETNTDVDLLEVIALTMDDEIWHVVVNGDDDTLCVKEPGTWTPPPQLKRRQVSNDDLWTGAMGKPLLWSWSLVNQQGYMDALQLEFAKDSSDISTIIQLIAMASTINIRKVIEVGQQ